MSEQKTAKELIDAAQQKLRPLLRQGEDYIWRPVLDAIEYLNQLRAALSPKPDRPMLSDAQILKLAESQDWNRWLYGDRLVALVQACIRADREGQP